MPTGFTEDGRAILSKSEFMELILTQRGYEKNALGEWELVSPELNVPKSQRTDKVTKTVTAPQKITAGKGVVTVPATKTLKPTTGNFTKESIISNVSNFLMTNSYNFTSDKASFLVVCGNENYELKITRKSAAFDFLDEFEGVKDFGKQKFIKQLQGLTFCNVGVTDTKGTVGLTDGKEYYTITITKKRK